MRNFYVKIGNGKSVSTFDIYWDIINPSNYATLFGSTTSATDITYSQMKSYPGVLVEVPDSAASIIVNSSQPTFCQGFGTSTTVYSYNLGTSSCIVPILESTTHNINDTVTYVWDVGGFDYLTGTTLLEYSINSGSSWVNVGTVSPNGPSATSSVISVSYGTPIQYRVVCYGNGCSGMISNVISSTFSGTPISFSDYTSFSVNPTGSPDSKTATGIITVNSGTHKLYVNASIYTNNSTTVNTQLSVIGFSTISIGTSTTGTITSSSFIQLISGTYSYTFNVVGSGTGGSGAGAIDIVTI